MQILNRLTIRNLKLNKRRTIVTIIGIILATALLTAVATMAVSLKESVTLRSKKVDGDFHLLLYDMTDKEKESVINNRQVESYYETHEVGYGVLDGCVNDSKPYVYIEALDSDTFEKAEINVTSGRLPEDDSEIVISSHIKCTECPPTSTICPCGFRYPRSSASLFLWIKNNTPITRMLIAIAAPNIIIKILKNL